MASKKHNVLVLGAGKVGKSVAELLLACGRGSYHVTVADRSDASLKEAVKGLDRLRKNVKQMMGRDAFDVTFDSVRLDVSNPAQVKRALKGKDSVVCMLPYDQVLGIAEAANAMGVHYFDVTEDVETTDAVRALDRKSKRAKVALVPQCGLAPGYIAIAAHEVAKDFDKVHSLTLRVGALPQFPTNQLKYNVTWSTEGVINEYCEPCNVMLDGKMVKVPALDGLEKFSLEGVEYEAFYTSGGVGTLIESLQKAKKTTHASNVAYKTIRYPGHCQLMKFLLQDLRLAGEDTTQRGAGSGQVRFDRRLVMDIFNHGVPRTLQDVVVVFINCIGEHKGRTMQVNFERTIPATQLFGRIWPAIELTTAAGVCAMVDLHRLGKLPQTGFITQESISLDTFNQTLFGLAYESPEDLEAAVIGS